MESRRIRAVAWLVRRVPLPPGIASRLMGWAQGTPPVPTTVAEVVDQQTAEAERSASG